LRLEEVEQHNERFSKGLVTFKEGINEYSDLDVEEFNEKINGFMVTMLSPKFFTGHQLNDVVAPLNLNYTQLGYVTSVRNQVRKQVL
jgi:hypothetical protein